MSIAIMSRLFKAQLGSCNRKLLAVRLADFADDDGRGIWPTVARLAAETELSERTIQRILREFEEEGLLVVVAEGGGRPGQATRYDFSMAALDRLFDRKPAAKGCQAVTHDTVSPMTPATATGDTGDGDGCHGVTQTVREPLDKPPTGGARETGILEEGETGKAETGASKGAIERAFRKWHPTWPTYLNGSEDAARREWFGLTDAERADCIERTPEFIEAGHAVKARFTFASVFLREKAWQKLPPRKRPEKPEPVKPFGHASMAYRFSELAAPEAALPKLTTFLQGLVDAGGERAASTMRQHRERYGWPSVTAHDDRIRHYQPVAVPARYDGIGADFQAVRRGTPLWDAWEAFRLERGWPPLPYGEKHEWFFFPPVAAGAADLNEAVAAAWWQFAERCKGHADAA